MGTKCEAWKAAIQVLLGNRRCKAYENAQQFSECAHLWFGRGKSIWSA